MVVDDDDDLDARRTVERKLDVDGVRDVDLRPAVVQEPGAVQENELFPLPDGRYERRGFLRVADRHQLLLKSLAILHANDRFFIFIVIVVAAAAAAAAAVSRLSSRGR